MMIFDTTLNAIQSTTEVTLHNCDEYKDCMSRIYFLMTGKQYMLKHLSNTELYYIVSPQDVVVARIRSMDDHIQWLLERARYERALQVARENVGDLEEYSVLSVGLEYIQYLVLNGKPNKAAALCPSIIGDNYNCWKAVTYIFQKNQCAEALAKYIPIDKLDLDESYVELILFRCMKVGMG